MRLFSYLASWRLAEPVTVGWVNVPIFSRPGVCLGPIASAVHDEPRRAG
jgi:hypothetical protein